VKDFSIFEQALDLATAARAENLGNLACITRRDFAESETFICSTTTASAEYVSLMIENALLLRTNRGGRVYAGFEQLSSLQPIIDRYWRIADVSESLYLFGQPDWEPPRHPNVRVISLHPDLRLASERFVIAQSSTFNCAFVALVKDQLMKSVAGELRYFAVKTSNRKVVDQLAMASEGVIDWSLAA